MFLRVREWEKAISIGDRSRFDDCEDWGEIYIFGLGMGMGVVT